ncbi:coiled-coil domain-containing protein 55 [Clonorchis sinensis]|uniref:Coiled-coil domain-containing protein 55 n=1 Tax=Clonorchis sinensis TaxID=79923 RepID=G7YTP5_CLOSI|nr:coiled-coil domain-containing protein 55 [Clonorchis sinensis]
MFHHNRKSAVGTSLPQWLLSPGPVLMRRNTRSSKYEPVVEEVELLECNPEYAYVRHSNGTEETVSLRHLAPSTDFGCAPASEQQQLQPNTDSFIKPEPSDSASETEMSNPSEHPLVVQQQRTRPISLQDSHAEDLYDLCQLLYWCLRFPLFFKSKTNVLCMFQVDQMIGKPEQKVYGLSFPTRTAKEKPKTLVESVFAAESDEEPDTAQLTKSDYEKAIEEDPSVFQYDEIYEDIRSEKDRQVNDILGGSKKESKYVGRLLKTAEERKLERELCLERKAQKEIEADAEQYGDKEAFVTSAYKEKLKQLQELVSKREEEQAREDYMDITKQQGLGGFYRYMYQHGMKPEETATASTSSASRMSSRDSRHSSRRSPTPRHETSRQREGTERDRTRSPKKPHSSDRHVDSNRPLDKSQRITTPETSRFPTESKNSRPADSKGGAAFRHKTKRKYDIYSSTDDAHLRELFDRHQKYAPLLNNAHVPHGFDETKRDTSS